VPCVAPLLACFTCSLSGNTHLGGHVDELWAHPRKYGQPHLVLYLKVTFACSPVHHYYIPAENVGSTLTPPAPSIPPKPM
jgi:hypothetical protein